MTSGTGPQVAVVANRGKVLDGGLEELRAVLAEQGIDDPTWYEVGKSKKAPPKARKAVKAGADILFVWGGDGTVQHCLEAVAGSHTVLAILPAGTANTVARNLGVPVGLREAVAVGLHGMRRVIDVMSANGERCLLMAGAGFDAELIDRADRGLKDRIGRLAYVWTALRSLGIKRRGTRVDVDGDTWFEGAATCVMVRQIPRIMGGLEVAPGARPDDGRLHVGVITARGPWQWLRVLVRLLTRRFRGSPLTRTTVGRNVEVRFDRKTRYELDGGERKPTKRLRVTLDPRALIVAVPLHQSL